MKSWLINSPLGLPGLFLFFLLLLLAAWPSGDKKKSRDEAKIGKKADDKRSPNRLEGGGEFTASWDQNPRGTRMNRNTKLGEGSEAGNPRAEFWLWPPQGQPGQKTKRRGLCGYWAAANLHQTDQKLSLGHSCSQSPRLPGPCSLPGEEGHIQTEGSFFLFSC